LDGGDQPQSRDHQPAADPSFRRGAYHVLDLRDGHKAAVEGQDDGTAHLAFCGLHCGSCHLHYIPRHRPPSIQNILMSCFSCCTDSPKSRPVSPSGSQAPREHPLEPPRGDMPSISHMKLGVLSAPESHEGRVLAVLENIRTLRKDLRLRNPISFYTTFKTIPSDLDVVIVADPRQERIPKIKKPRYVEVFRKGEGERFCNLEEMKERVRSAYASLFQEEESSFRPEPLQCLNGHWVI
jgi:hypothetical protein